MNATTSAAKAPKTAATGTAAKPATKRVEPSLTAVRSDVTMPVRSSNRGSKSLYLFDALTSVGMSFGILNKSADQLTSIISNQNRKTYPVIDEATGKPKMTEIKDGQGNVVGFGSEPQTYQKHFFAVDVDPKSDPDKASVRIFRDE